MPKKNKDTETSGMSLIDLMVDEFKIHGAKKFSDVNIFLDGTWCSLNVPTFDHEMDFIGFPSGIVEIRGESMSGKTTLAYQVLANAVNEFSESCIPVILSAENRDNRALADSMGVDVSKIMLLHPKSTEDCQNLIMNTVSRGAEIAKSRLGGAQPKFVFVLDSMGQLFSASEAKKISDNADNDDDKAQSPGASAKANNSMLRAVKVLAQQHDITFLVINRTYDKIGFMQRGKVSAGGSGITYLPGIRIELRRTSDITMTSVDRPIGQEVEISVIKNDFGAPRHKFKIDLMFGYGYTLSNNCLRMALDAGYIEKYSYGFKSNIDGIDVSWKNKREFLDLLESKDQGLKDLTRCLTQKVHESVMAKRGLA